MTLALWLVVAASVIHVTEEYLWPGGFLDAMRETAPRFAFAVNAPVAVVINAMFVGGVIAAALVGSRAPVFALSAAALIAVNGWGHAAGTLRGRRYIPGALSGLLLSQPVAVLAYLEFGRAGLLSAIVVMASLFLGVAYHVVPLGYFGIRWLARRRRPEETPAASDQERELGLQGHR
jgi:Protein of unknown function with HXXEE motif